MPIAGPTGGVDEPDVWISGRFGFETVLGALSALPAGVLTLLLLALLAGVPFNLAALPLPAFATTKSLSSLDSGVSSSLSSVMSITSLRRCGVVTKSDVDREVDVQVDDDPLGEVDDNPLGEVDDDPLGDDAAAYNGERKDTPLGPVGMSLVNFFCVGGSVFGAAAAARRGGVNC